MEIKTNEIDILIVLEQHGWSITYLLIDGKIHEFSITHVFNKPYEETMHALLNVAKGQDDSFVWYSEPYGAEFSIEHMSKGSPLIKVSITGTEYMETVEPDLITEFTTDIRTLIVLFYYQFKKTAKLLEDKTFAEKRAKDFPFHTFKEFEKLAMQYIE